MEAASRLEGGPLVVPQPPGALLSIRVCLSLSLQDSPRFCGTALFLKARIELQIAQ